MYYLPILTMNLRKKEERAKMQEHITNKKDKGRQRTQTLCHKIVQQQRIDQSIG